MEMTAAIACVKTITIILQDLCNHYQIRLLFSVKFRSKNLENLFLLIDLSHGFYNYQNIANMPKMQEMLSDMLMDPPPRLTSQQLALCPSRSVTHTVSFLLSFCVFMY